MKKYIDIKSIGAGMVTCFLTVGIPLILAIFATHVLKYDKSKVSFYLIFIVIFGYMLGGYRCALTATKSPLGNSIICGFAASVVLSVVKLLVMSTDQMNFQWFASNILSAILATIPALIGAFVAIRAPKNPGTPQN